MAGPSPAQGSRRAGSAGSGATGSPCRRSGPTTSSTIATRYWGLGSAPEGWTVEFGTEPIAHVDHDVAGAPVTHVVDGIDYFGWACPQHRLILVQPFAGADCIERSVIFHELGHAWGVREGDPRLYGEYALMRQAMEASGWRGCLDLAGAPP